MPSNPPPMSRVHSMVKLAHCGYLDVGLFLEWLDESHRFPLDIVCGYQGRPAQGADHASFFPCNSLTCPSLISSRSNPRLNMSTYGPHHSAEAFKIYTFASAHTGSFKFGTQHVTGSFAKLPFSYFTGIGEAPDYREAEPVLRKGDQRTIVQPFRHPTLTCPDYPPSS